MKRRQEFLISRDLQNYGNYKSTFNTHIIDNRVADRIVAQIRIISLVLLVVECEHGGVQVGCLKIALVVVFVGALSLQKYPRELFIYHFNENSGVGSVCVWGGGRGSVIQILICLIVCRSYYCTDKI